MVIPEEREGRTEEDPALSRDVTPANLTVHGAGAKSSSSRKGGVDAPAKQRKVTLSLSVFSVQKKNKQNLYV